MGNPTAVILCETDRAFTSVCGVPLLVRWLNLLRDAELREVVVIAPRGDAPVRAAIAGARGMRVTGMESVGDLRALASLADTALLVIESHYLLDKRIVLALARMSGYAIACDKETGSARSVWLRVQNGFVMEFGATPRGTHVYAGAARVDADALARIAGESSGWQKCLEALARQQPFAACEVESLEFYDAGIRRHLKPFWRRIDGAEDARLCREALVERAQKHTLDLMGWYVNRPIENFLLRRVADLPITPNQMTVLVNIVAYCVTGLFFLGQLTTGALLALLVNVLDGLDGKLARVKGMATQLGQMEHSFDVLFEQSWYVAFGWAASNGGANSTPLLLTLMLLCLDTFARHVSIQFHHTTGISLSDYAPFDRLFRRIDGRRNIYTVYLLLGAITGAPLWSLAVIAAHAGITGAVYAVRAIRHLNALDKSH